MNENEHGHWNKWRHLHAKPNPLCYPQCTSGRLYTVSTDVDIAEAIAFAQDSLALAKPDAIKSVLEHWEFLADSSIQQIRNHLKLMRVEEAKKTIERHRQDIIRLEAELKNLTSENNDAAQ